MVEPEAFHKLETDVEFQYRKARRNGVGAGLLQNENGNVKEISGFGVPCCTYLEGQYGINDLCMGVPVKLGAGGVEEVIEIKLTDEEKAALNKSAASVRELVEVMHKNQASEAKAS